MVERVSIFHRWRNKGKTEPREHLKPEEDFEPKAFRIRGRHLDQFAELEKIHSGGTINPVILPDKLICDNLKDDPNESRWAPTNVSPIYEKYLNLPPSYPVEIVEGEKDEICNASVKGEKGQCSVRDNSHHGFGLDSDGAGLNQFMTLANRLHLVDKISISYETAIHPDVPPTRVRIFRMPSKVVKTILGTW